MRPMGSGAVAPTRRAIVGLLLVLLGFPGMAEAQRDVPRLAGRCAGEVSELANPCREFALAVQAAQGLVGLAAAGGTELPGSSSTLGRRFSGFPRIALGLSGGVTSGSFPESLSNPDTPAADDDAFGWTLQAHAALGVTNGFSIAPTVGGILSVDVLASLAVISLPGGEGFPESARGGGLGVRVGVLRESFTLPGVTVSLSRRWMGKVRLGESASDGAEAGFEVTATSLRATVGKGILGLGLLGGFGWDRYDGDVDLTVDGGTPEIVGSVSDVALRSDRWLFFGGIGYTFLVAQLSVEGGYAQGFEAIQGRDGDFDPESGSAFLRVAFRLTL